MPCFQDHCKSKSLETISMNKLTNICRDKHEYVGQLKELEAEMDHQVKQVENRVKQKAEQELEAERRSVREVMKEEMDELHAHMQMFQKVMTSDGI